MKTEIKEHDPSHQLLSVKKSHGRRRGKKKSRSALPEGSETSGADPPPAQHGDVTSQPGGVTSQPGGVTSQPDGAASQHGDVTSQAGDVTSQSGDVMSQSDGATSQLDGAASQLDDVTSDATGCEACGIQARNPAQLAAHLNSQRHARRRRELRILAALSDTADVTEAADKEVLAARLARGNARLEASAPLKDTDLPDCITKKCEGKVRQKVSYSCDLCSVQLTSLVKVQEHLASQRHTAVQEGRPPPVRSDRHSARKAKTKAAAKQSWFW